MIGIVDYGVGNLASVRNALEHLGHQAQVCDAPERIVQFERLILPGVGSFRSAMAMLVAAGWVDALKHFAASGRPVLGICLGMQLLFDIGDENGPTTGLGLIPGTVVRLSPSAPNKVPHVGWNNLTRIAPHPLLLGVKSEVDFYFVHSYHCIAKDPNSVIAICNFGGDFVASAAIRNVAGVQFHPEKSQPAGMRILENFSEWDPEC